MAGVTINGNTYTDDSNASTGLANGGHRTRFIPLIADVVTVAAQVADGAAAVQAESPVANAAAAAASAAAAAIDAAAAAAISESGLPSQAGKSGYFLSTNGSNTLWDTVSVGVVAASAVTTTPAGTLAATDVQAALNELDSEKGGLAVAQTWTAAQTFDGGLIVTDEVRETPVVANTGAGYTVAIANGTLFDLTLTGNCIFTFPTATAGRQFTLLLNQDATGSRTVTWPSSVRWAGGSTPTITATASKTDVLSFVSGGTYWLGFVGGQNYTRA